MQLPIVAPAPIVVEHAQAFRDLFCDQRQFDHFQNYLTAMIVLDDKSLSNISRCILESSDKSNLSRFLSQSPWNGMQVSQRRVKYMLAKTVTLRPPAKDACLIVDDTLCEHVGNLFEYVERHYNHSDGRYPLAHNLVTSHYVSGAVRFPVNFEVYRRYETATEWEAFVQRYFPEQNIPKTASQRQVLHRQLDPQLMADEQFRRLHEQFYSKHELALVLIQQAIDQRVPFQTVLTDSWYLTRELVNSLAQDGKDWVSLLKCNRNLEVRSFQLKDEQGQVIALPGKQIKVQDLVPLIPKTAYRKVTIDGRDYWCFSFCPKVSSLGKIRLVISFANPECQGTYAIVATNRKDWSAYQILSKYLQRWPVETFYWESKQLLGLDQYRMRSLSAIENHWHLVFLAYCILHLACLPPPSRKGQGTSPAHPIQTVGEVCRQQGQALIEALIWFAHELLEQGQSASDVCLRLFAKQQPKLT
jgi:SRSO17 transposase